ncbi:MAG: filamentous hemagglutinin family protein [Thiobacillus sp.]|nr:filamentous hemagglutinin family protein [Thiobacillus sp.]
MNRNRYRLVFNTALGMLTPVAETARKQGKASGRTTLMLAGAVLAGHAHAAPLPPVAANALPDHTSATITHGSVGFTTGSRTYNSIDYNSLTIKVATDKAIIQWNNGLSIGSQAWVDVNHATGATGRTLHRVLGGDPSQFYGRFTSNGQEMIVNQNGILFGNGAQIDVNTLTASSLNIQDTLFLNGLLSQTGVPKPVFEGGSGYVKVMDGARIAAAKGGRVMLLGPTVSNAGSIAAPEGQVVLAAGNKVYLINSDDANLRGLLVEVSNDGVSDTKQSNTGVHDEIADPDTDNLGTATNSGSGFFYELRQGAGDYRRDDQGNYVRTESGKGDYVRVDRGLLSERGNISMVGLAVNQSGLARATTSVQLNGSIYLKAQDTVTGGSLGGGSTPRLDVGRAGELVLSSGSRTEILPDDNATQTITDSQTFNRSQVRMTGKTIQMESDAGIVAPGGNVVFSALTNPSSPNHESSAAAPVEGVRVDFQSGSFVDVSGTSVQVAASRNVVQAELRGDELKDSPLQRDGFLYGKKVWVDVTKGTPLADVSGYTSALGRTVGEKSTTGGDILVQSEGDIVMRTGATFDISGGQVDYTAGLVPTTRLISNGKSFDISEAPPDRVYSGISGQYTISNPKFGVEKTVVVQQAYRYESGYVEGKDAGKASFVSPWLVKNGTVLAHTVTGPYQRDPATRPNPGEILIGSVSGTAQSSRLLSTALFGTPLADPVIGLGTPLPEAYKTQVVLSPDFVRNGVGKLRIFSNGEIIIPEGQALALAASGQRKDANGNTVYGGGVTLSGARVTVADDIRAPSGEIFLQAREVAGIGTPSTVAVADGVRLDASGVWTNDSLVGSAADNISGLAYQGGRVAIEAARDVVLSEDSLVDVSGGGWLQANGKLKGGEAGRIELSSDINGDAAVVQRTSSMTLGGTLRGEALGNGGTLKIKTASVEVRDTPRDAADPDERLVLSSAFFGQGGFAEYEVEGVDGLKVAEGVTIAPVVGSLELRTSELAGDRLRTGGALLPSGTDMREVTRQTVLPAHLRQAARLTFKSGSQYYGGVEISSGASVRTEPGGSINLSSGRQLTVHGALLAQGGKIALTLDGRPADASDPGFRPKQTIWLADTSRLDAAGVAKTYVDGKGLNQGDVLKGGQVSLIAKKGYVVQESGSVIDVSGAPTVLLGTRNADGGTGQAVASDAGSVTITAREGILMDGAVVGRAGSANTRGGEYSAAVDRTEGNSIVRTGGNTAPDAGLGFSLYPTADREMVVRDTGTSVPEGLQAGAAVPLSENGKAYVNLGDLERQGFDRFSLKSDSRLVFQGPLDVGQERDLRSLSLNAQTIASMDGNPVNLKARYVSLGNTSVEQNELTAAGTAAQLNVQADLIDFIGRLALDNFQSQFNSAGDIRFRGYNSPTTLGEAAFMGGLTTMGDLSFEAAQLYPTTLTRFEVKTDPINGAIRIVGNGKDVPAPLSALGALSFDANMIDQGGTVHAPFGTLSFNATDGLNLLPGSVTSVSGRDAAGKELLVPLGSTLNEREWVYYDAPLTSFSDDSLIPRLTALPSKGIELNGNSVTVAAATATTTESKPAARVDVSGGGDLLGYEFFVGPGGSKDVLAVQGVYAILPAYQDNYAPTDVQNDINFDRLPGDQVYLTGGNGLAAGLYTLLPAHYALLPGAMLVRPVAGSKDFFPQQAYLKQDGIRVMSGFIADTRYDTSTGTGPRDARWSAFEVLTHAQVRARSEYGLYSANRFFPAIGADRNLPQDAAALAFDISGTTLELAGDFDLSAGGRGAALDIAAHKLAIAPEGTTGLDADVLRLDPAILNDLDAESVLIGGLRTAGSDIVAIDVKASDVQVANNATSALIAPEIILAAAETVEVRDSSVLKGVGETRGGHVYRVEGEGALLLASSQNADFARTGNPGTDQGELIVGSGASITASRSLVVDGTMETRNQGILTFANAAGEAVDGGRLTLGASRISVGGEAEDIPENVVGLKLTQDDLDRFRDMDTLTFNTYSSLDLYGESEIGGDSVSALNLNGGGIRGLDNAGKTATLQAKTIRLSNSGGVSAGAAGSGSGTLDIETNTLTLAEGDKALSGFETLNITAREIVGEGQGKLDAGTADTTLTSARISGRSGSTQTLTTFGTLATVRMAVDGALADVTDLGAKWVFEGESVSHGSKLDLPSGTVFMTATNGDLVIAPTGRILAQGVAVPFADTSVAVPGGKVVLISKTGNIEIQSLGADTALVNVSAVTGGEAGHLGISAANGTAEIAADSIQGTADYSEQSASFALDVSKLDADKMDFSTLNARLDTGGFKRAQDVRVRTGDVSIAAGETVTAHDYTLAADSGAITVEGMVDASGNQGGKIGLYASNGLTLKTDGKLDARASGAGERGGKVELAAGVGALDLQGGEINVNPGVGGEKGEVLLRANRQDNNASIAGDDEVNVSSLDAAIQGAGSVVLEAVKLYDGITSLASIGSGTTLGYGTINTDNANFMTLDGDGDNIDNATDIKTRLGKVGDASFHLRPGVEVRSTGDLTVSADWNLYSASRPGGEPGVLTLRSKGNLKVDGSISDGFSTAATTGTLQAGDSWSYRLVAGADHVAANPMATWANAGNFELKAGKLVRTGTGDIRIAAGGDFDLGKAATADAPNSQDSVIYTAGTLAPALTDFTNPTGAVFSQNGGDIDIRVQGDIRGAESNQLYTSWLYRQGKVNLGGVFNAANPKTAWWVKFSDFKQGVAALGGGNVHVQAGKSIEDLSVSSVTQGRLAVDASDNRALQVLGGGDVRVEAEGDILGGKFYVAQGEGEILAGNTLGKGQEIVATVSGKSVTYPVYPILALGDGEWKVRARGDAALATVLNPFILKQASGNAASASAAQAAVFLTYDADSGIDLISLGGDATLANQTRPLVDTSKGSFTVTEASAEADAMTIYPGRVSVAALRGDVVVESSQGMALFPSEQGHLELLADGSVSMGLIHMSDMPAELVPDPVTPQQVTSAIGNVANTIGSTMVSPQYAGKTYHAAEPYHALDSQPVRVVAKHGDISGVQSNKGRGLLLPKPAVIEAAGDIRNLTLITQHYADDDLTRIKAGGDIAYPDADDKQFIQVWGPGTLYIDAGGDLDLGASLGIVTRGNLDNQALPEQGAGVQVLTGTARYFERVAELIAVIHGLSEGSEMPSELLDEARMLSGNPELAPDSALDVLRQASLLAGSLARLQGRIEQTLASGNPDEVLLRQAQIMTGNDNLAWSEAPAALSALVSKPESEREELGRAFLVNALNKFGSEAADPKSENFKNYDAAYSSLDLVFPGSNCAGERCNTANYAGDVNLFFSQIKTERGGSIEVLTPGGRILAGLASTPLNLLDRKDGAQNGVVDFNEAAAKLGIMTLGGGDIHLVAADDVLVNQSRVLTVAGGDILAWSSFEDIDAGKGKKTATSAPPPQTRTDNAGNTITEIQGIASGSGIGTLITKPDQLVSNIGLYAPKGSINAGDAGIRSAGNLTLGAQQVIGADNIQTGGLAVGVPAADAGAISAATGASTSGGEDVAKTTAALSENLAEAARAAEELKNAFKPTFITAEVIGHGD